MRAAVNSESFLFLTQFLASYNVEPEAIEFLRTKLTSERLRKGDEFSIQGKICDKIGILVAGLLYASFQPENEEDEKVSRFFYSPRNIIVTSFESFNEVRPSSESIIALEDSFLLCISREDLNRLYELSPEVNTIGRKLAEESYIQLFRRARALQTLDGEDLIKDFWETHPELVNHPSISLQQIASYLGIHRNTYRRLANNC